ncbi:MAG: DnaD domain protein [Acholeplasmatales bacterium]|nr:DnaD domain protein [Acholeplasmatales bacterium]
MPSKLLDEKSSFQVYSSFSLSADDVNSLSLLYAPLIGSDAFTIYMGLQSLLERNNLKSETYTHQNFLDMYSYKSTEFYKARIKLEAIGLLITYINNDGNYIYIITPPLTPKNFIKDAQLGLFLYGKIGEELFDKIYNHFKIDTINKKDYKNITSSFDDVFKSGLDLDKTYKKFDYLLGKNPSQPIILKNTQFDFDKFYKEINPDFLESGLTNQFKNQIVNLAFSYNYSEGEMVSLYSDSINKRGLFDYKLLKKTANAYFVSKHNMKAPTLEENSLDNKIDSNSDLVNYLDNVNPENLFNSLGLAFDPDNFDTINRVYSEIELPRGVLNTMVYRAVKMNGEMPKFMYFKKMAITWIKDNIFTTSDAIRYITEARFKVKDADEKENGGFEEL